MTREDLIEELQRYTADGWTPRTYERLMEYSLLYINHLSDALKHIAERSDDKPLRDYISATLDIDA